jgi:serine protease SohB
VEFLQAYGLFLAKTITLLGSLVAVIAVFAGFAASGRRREKDRLEIKHLNQRYDDMADAIRGASLTPKEIKKALKARERARKARLKSQTHKKRLYVLDFHGDLRATAVAALREEISALLLAAEEGDEVIVRLESGGGLVHSYGLGASQLQRIRDKGIRLTVAVDKVAASGGYLMACVADRIVAAPFAIVGSIGVLSQLPNFSRLLKRHDIDFEQITAGEYKRTLTLFGENTDTARQKVREEVEDTHALFKDFVKTHRPIVDLEKVSTGEHWFGTRAMELKLVDALKSSDDLLLEAQESFDLYGLSYQGHRRLLERLLPKSAHAALIAPQTSPFHKFLSSPH